MEPFTDADRASTAWQKMREYLERELEVARAQLENDLDENKTARLRGDIARIKKCLRYAQGRPEIKVSEPPSYSAA